jgi:hypothetical protein
MPSLQSRVARLALEVDGPFKTQLVAALRHASPTDELEEVLGVWEDNEGKADMLRDFKRDPAAFKHDLLALAEDVGADAKAVERAYERMTDLTLGAMIQRLAYGETGETDAEGKFEKGKKVPLSQLPEALQYNAENPPAEVQELKKQMEKKNKTAAWDSLKDASTKRAELDRKTLNQLVEMAAESSEYDNSRDAEATPEVKMAADKFTRALSKALSVYAQKHPPEDGSTVGDLMDAEGAYLVYMTLEGHGVGIWDGRWDKFYDNTKSLERFLGRALDRPHQDLNTAIENAAFETAGGV